MANVRDILEKKGQTVHTIGPHDTVLDALRMMADRNIGAVLVVDEGRVVGIFTERLYAREVFLKGRASPTTPVGDVMQREVVCVSPDQSAEACMALMTDKYIRHLPVMQDGELVGIVSIGDLMKSVIEDREFHIEQLVDYVRG